MVVGNATRDIPMIRGKGTGMVLDRETRFR